MDVLLSGKGGFERYAGAWVPGVVEQDIDGGGRFTVRLCGFKTERADKRSEEVAVTMEQLARPRLAEPGREDWKKGDHVQAFWIAENVDDMDSWWDAVVVRDGINGMSKVLIKWK